MILFDRSIVLSYDRILREHYRTNARSNVPCFFCHKDIEITDRIGRRETCPHCGLDLHICRNCEFYDSTAYNECREPQAERVVDKEKSNFCDYFSPSSFPSPLGERAGVRGSDPVAEAKKKLEGLFKK